MEDTELSTIPPDPERKGLELRYSPDGLVPMVVINPENLEDSEDKSSDEGEQEKNKNKEEEADDSDDKDGKKDKKVKKKSNQDKDKKKKGKKKKKKKDGNIEKGDKKEEEADDSDDEAPDEKSIPVTSKYVLRSYNDTPFYLRSNKFIRDGYRVNFSFGIMLYQHVSIAQRDLEHLDPPPWLLIIRYPDRIDVRSVDKNPGHSSLRRLSRILRVPLMCDGPDVIFRTVSSVLLPILGGVSLGCTIGLFRYTNTIS